MSFKHAGELMIPLDEYPGINHWDSIITAINVIGSVEIVRDGKKSLPRALLVFDDTHRVLGTVRRRDILKGLEPKFLKTMSIPERKQLFNIEVDQNLIELSKGQISEEIVKRSEQPVSEIMQPFQSMANYHDHLAKVIFKMVNRDMNLIPITREKEIVGVVRSVDVFREVAQIVL